MSYQLYLQISRDEKYTYKLLQLPPEILSHLQNDSSQDLLLKSNINSLVLCTNDQTWKLRQMNHSNSVLLLNNVNITGNNTSITDPVNTLVGFQNCNYEYELTKTEGIIDFSQVAKYDGHDYGASISITQLLNDSLCSESEFWKLWWDNSGCEIDGNGYLMTDEFVTELLFDLITFLISQEINYNQPIDITQLDELLSPKINSSMIKSILHRFATKHVAGEDTYTLVHHKIAQWFGIIQLSTRAHEVIPISEFLINWKASLPPFYNISLDIEYLNGWYAMPQDRHILYVDRRSLSTNLATRFKQLFQVHGSWDYQLFVAFIKDIVPKDKKLDGMIIKFGKKKKVGKDKFIVCPR